MKCKNCHSSNVNTSKSSLPLIPKLIFYAIAGMFAYAGIKNLREGFLFVIIAFAFAAAIYFFAKKIVSISYYCNNCKYKWNEYDYE
jgi:predicted neutral ceramidase superfamily lipid hydrolase